MSLSFRCVTFQELTTTQLYAMLQLRERVFVVEQACPYLDLDGQDQAALHILGLKEHRVIATARILAPGDRHAHVSIGRVVTSPDVRGEGVGRSLMQAALDAVQHHFGPSTPIALSAQSYLIPFYSSLGFEACSDEYVEDGIPHTDMLLG